jgi:hypothetical protein
MYMYPSTRMLAHSRVPHTFTYISFGYDMLTAARKGTSYLWYSSDYHISYIPRTAVQLYYATKGLPPLAPCTHPYLL